MRFRPVVALFFLAVAGSGGAARAFVFSSTFVNGSGTDVWTAAEQAVANQAMTDWTNRVSFGGANDQTVNIQFDLVHGGAGNFLAQWTYLSGGGTLANPYSPNIITHEIDLNIDQIPADYIGLDAPPPGSGYDLLTIIRHELGHAMGFYTPLYSDSGGDLWGRHIINGVFDPSGLNVPMYLDSIHVSTSSDLMYYSLAQGTRKEISDTDLNMLALADGYTILPAPEPASLTAPAIAAVALLFRRRRRVAQ